MAIGWDEMGDLSQYPDHESLGQALINVYKLEGYPMNDSRACEDFVRVVKPGDRIIAKRGRDEVVGYGVVTGPYAYRPERATYRNVRQVRWERRGNWKCNEPVFAVKTLTDLTRFPDTVRYLTDLIGVSGTVPAPSVETVPPYAVESDILRLLLRSRLGVVSAKQRRGYPATNASSAIKEGSGGAHQSL